MTHYAFMDKNAGLVHFVGQAKSINEAFTAMQDDIGGDVGELSDWHIYELTAKEAKEVLAWAHNGSPSSECPAALK